MAWVVLAYREDERAAEETLAAIANCALEETMATAMILHCTEREDMGMVELLPLPPYRAL